MQIRRERSQDVAGVRTVTLAAFKDMAYSDQKEADIIDALRAAGALALSLVAADSDQVLGHAAFSRVDISAADGDWYGLGPVSVLPERHRQGIGGALIEAGLAELRTQGAAGCVVLGDPAYYGRFGFESDPALRYGDEPSPYLQRLVFSGAPPAGQVRYHAGFDV